MRKPILLAIVAIAASLPFQAGHATQINHADIKPPDPTLRRWTRRP